MEHLHKAIEERIGAVNAKILRLDEKKADKVAIDTVRKELVNCGQLEEKLDEVSASTVEASAVLAQVNDLAQTLARLEAQVVGGGDGDVEGGIAKELRLVEDRLNDLSKGMAGKAEADKVQQVVERGDLLEKMVFNGVNVLVLGILTLAGAGLFFRALDTKRVDEKAVAVQKNADRLEADLKNKQSGLVVELTKSRDEALQRLRESMDKKNEELTGALGELRVSASKSDNLLRSELQLQQDRIGDRTANLETKVDTLQGIVSDKVNVRLDQLGAVAARMRSGAITTMTRQYENALSNAAIYTPDEIAAEAIHDNRELIQELRAMRLVESTEASRDAELDFLLLVHDCVVGYNKFLRGGAGPGAVGAVGASIANARAFDMGAIDSARRERLSRFDAYLANLKGMLELKQYLEHSGEPGMKMLDLAEQDFEYARSHGQFIKPYSNLAIVFLERARVEARSADSKRGALEIRLAAAGRAEEIMRHAPSEAHERAHAVKNNNRAHVMLERASCCLEYAKLCEPKSETEKWQRDCEKGLREAEKIVSDLLMHSHYTPVMLITKAEIRAVRTSLEHEQGALHSQDEIDQVVAEIADLLRQAREAGYSCFQNLDQEQFFDRHPYFALLCSVHPEGCEKRTSILLRAAGIPNE
ncbi:MAG: hypothetical protein H6819_03470 [Phycisphaerales bacterium]|nr:hypothetical protein [Phycisphaerales bacterium]MCB9856256.1 hypothetical protein [Phycisphaerales bacterium]MCB9863305.1 hypothetical protein [Phycisphaerales bacterium]